MRPSAPETLVLGNKNAWSLLADKKSGRFRGGAASTQMDWQKPLVGVITPKSGPLSRMVTLIDANRSLVGELPQGYLKRPHWLRAGKALVTAAETGESSDVECAYEAIVAALDEEGWLSIAENPLGNPIRRGQQTTDALTQL
jgi:hypothetical protein